ncbi:MAG: hypothetical protein R3B57_03555 [Phycisphaerales bacterium]
MSTLKTRIDDLYSLVPSRHRELDAELGYPLRGLLELVQQQAEIVADDIDGLYNDAFIETCARWAIPYIGDLVSNRTLHTAESSSTTDTATELFDDLVGPDLRPLPLVRIRADVAKTIYYRRRKGTLPMLEELARDVTGWAAHAVEFFQLLTWQQNPNHVRFHSPGFADLRRVERCGRVDGPFDEFAHTVDVARIDTSEGTADGWHNIRHIGFFLWRLGSYALVRAKPRPAASAPAWRFHFSPTGNPAPLFNAWVREGDESGLSNETHAPAPVRRARFYENLREYRATPPTRHDSTGIYGPMVGVGAATPDSDAAFYVVRNGAEFPAYPTFSPAPNEPAEERAAPGAFAEPRVVCRILDPWPATQPTGGVIAIDTKCGRLALGDGLTDPSDPTTSLAVDFRYGFAADLGGGPYARDRWLAADSTSLSRLYVSSDGVAPTGSPAVTHTKLTDAITAWQTAGRPDTVITIYDNWTYDLPASVTLTNTETLTIEAADAARPLLVTQASGLEVDVDPPISADADRRGVLTFNGVVVEGFIHVIGDLGKLRLIHATLVPGRSLLEDGSHATTEPSVIAEPTSAGSPINAQLSVEMAYAIAGPLRLPGDAQGLWLLDSIVDGLDGIAIASSATDSSGAPFPACELHAERSTVLGECLLESVAMISECVMTKKVVTRKTGDGCVRYSFIPRTSKTPQRYRCQPDLEISQRVREAEEQAITMGTTLSAADRAALQGSIARWLWPTFTSTSYGDPGYAQLRLVSPRQILTGAEDESEMGVFCHLKQNQRETNLRIRLEEYLPLALDAGLIYVT